MYQLNEFNSRDALDVALADKIAQQLENAVKQKGKASIAVSGGSTPKGLFKVLSAKDLPWENITITLADERWVPMDSKDSNTKLVHENLLQDQAAQAKFFHIKQGEELTEEVLADLNLAANSSLLPFDVLILGMGEDGHTASLFPCSEQITHGLADDCDALLKVEPTTAPHTRISFSFQALKKSASIILHICGASKKEVMEQALAEEHISKMPIKAFLQDPEVNTEVFWAE